MKKKKDPVETTNTASVQTDSFAGPHIPSAEGLLGPAALRLPSQPKFLLRLARTDVPAALLEKIGTPQYKFESLRENQHVPLVTGPFDVDVIKEWIATGDLQPQDLLLSGFGRWKTVRVHFPEIRGSLTGEEDLTNTSTMEKTGTVTLTDTMELESQGVDEVVAPSLEPALEYTKLQGGAPAKPATLEIEHPAPAPAPASRSSKAEKSGGPANKVKAPSSRSAAWTYASIAVFAFVLGGIYRFKRGKMDVSSKSSLEAKAKNWPPQLQPRSLTSLYDDQGSPLLEKLRPILQAYQNGATVLSSHDELTLKGIADPASASWEARKLAANQLMVFYLAKSRLGDARRILQPIVDAVPTDPTTLLNDAILKFAEGDLSSAREAAGVAVRLSPPGQIWVAHSLLGMIHGATGRNDEAEKSFQNALLRSSNNPYIYGMWVQSLMRNEGTSNKSRIPQLLREALWADPDRLLDSPIRAPLAGHILMAEALAGLRKGVEVYSSLFSVGQIAFFRSLEARSFSNPLSDNLTKTKDLLSRDPNAQSQLIYAYLLNEEGKTEQASDVLSRVIPLLETQKVMSSWPWTFAGDVQRARGQEDRALIFYQAALSRNPQDPAAVLGLALNLREAGDFKAAQQKLAESLALDPLFIPALLRTSRFDWHRSSKME